MKRITGAVLGLSFFLGTRLASAFCGFYVSGADAKLFNDATQVALMREGTRTVLSMQNDYQGPPESFAMVVPVPVILQKENVKTTSKVATPSAMRGVAPSSARIRSEDDGVVHRALVTATSRRRPR